MGDHQESPPLSSEARGDEGGQSTLPPPPALHNMSWSAAETALGTVQRWDARTLTRFSRVSGLELPEEPASARALIAELLTARIAALSAEYDRSMATAALTRRYFISDSR